MTCRLPSGIPATRDGPMPSPLISVALSTYNGAAHLREQVDSVLAQQDVALELVAVDDGSSDATYAMLEEYARHDPRVRCSRNPRNLGPTAGFERAMSLCIGEFIAPCDQDDIWDPRKLAVLLAAMDGVDLAYCDSGYIDAEGRPLQRRVSDDLPMMAGRDPLPFAFANTVSGHAALLRRDLFERARPFPEGVFHDWWLALHAAGGMGVRYVDQPLVRFRRHEGSFSNVGSRRSAMPTAQWLYIRRTLLAACDARHLRGHAHAQAIDAGLQAALRGESTRQLLAALWRARAFAPRWSGVQALDALRLQLKFVRKVARARRAGTQPG